MTVSSYSLRALYGMDFPSASYFGGTHGPLVDGNTNGEGDFMPDLATIEAGSARVFLKFTGSSAGVRVPVTIILGGVSTSVYSFSLDLWKGKMDKAFTHATNAQIKPYVTSGALVANYMLDDIKSGNGVFHFGPTFLDLEAMAAYSKAQWPDVPCCVRAENTYLETLALAHTSTSSYSWMDFGWAQWINRFAKPDTYYANHINAGKRMRLGSMIGFNILNGGSGITAPWNIHAGQTKDTAWGMSPMELDACTAAYTAHKADVLGLYGWSANPTFDHNNYYGTYTGIQEALTRMANAIIGQVHGPINGHAPIVTPPTDVVGDWALRSAGVHFRSNNPTSPDIPLPTCEENDLLCILAYSRDSGRVVTKPADMTEAARVSGHSLRGGELVLFVKLAAGTEGGTTKTLTLTGSATNTAFQAQSFSFSGNTHVLANLIDTVGSDSSWGGGSANMGPVKGPLTSSSSDCMVLLCAAKTNDFNNGDPPPFTTMSATTHDNESWNRLFMTTNVSGDDSGMFADYCFINGKQSITSKSWTQDAGAGASSMGSGCGFMVSFKPARIASVAVVPPTLVEIEDIDLSLGDSLGITLTAETGTAPITFSKTSAPSALAINASTGVVDWTPSASGLYYIILAATNAGGTDTDDFFVQVATTATNHAPLITNPGNMTVLVQERTTFTVAATDEDGDTLVYSMDAGSPIGATINPSTGFFDYTPQDVGTFPVVLVVSDGRLESRSTFTFTVTDQTLTPGGLPWTKVLGPHLGPPGNQFRRF